MHAFHPRWVVVSRTPSKVSRVSEAGCDVTRIQQGNLAGSRV